MTIPIIRIAHPGAPKAAPPKSASGLKWKWFLLGDGDDGGVDDGFFGFFAALAEAVAVTVIAMIVAAQ